MPKATTELGTGNIQLTRDTHRTKKSSMTKKSAGMGSCASQLTDSARSEQLNADLQTERASISTKGDVKTVKTACICPLLVTTSHRSDVIEFNIKVRPVQVLQFHCLYLLVPPLDLPLCSSLH